MSQELIRSDSVLGTKQVIAGSRDKDFVIQTKGKVKIQQGNSFIDLIKDGKINAPVIIHVVDTINDIGTKTGFYYVRNEDGMYALVEKSLIPLGGGAGNNNNNSEGVTKLSELEDVMLVNLRDGDLLVQQGGYWVNTLFNVNDLEDMITGNLDEIRDALKNQSDFTQRTWQDVMETFDMMFDPEGNYFTEKITPLAVHTAQLIVGTNSQQFSLENIKFSPNHLGDENRFAAFIVDISRPGLLIHNTIGLENNDDTVGATWEVLHNISGSLTAPDFDQTGLDPGKPYYLYAKCSKTSNQGEFLLSTEQKLLESEDGYYMFWVGVLNTPRASLSEGGSEISGGVSDSTVKASKVRSFQTMYGFTEIAGNTITTGVIKDQTGNCYWDMINGNFRIGNGNTYIRFDSDLKQLFIKGYITQEDPDSTAVMINWRGPFIQSSNIKYNKGDVVSYEGSTYICIKDVYGNVLPTNTNYWNLYTSKGDNGEDGASFRTIFYDYDERTPSTPSPSYDVPSGWSASALAPSERWPVVWYSNGVKDVGESLWTWSTPAVYTRLVKDGDPGPVGPAMNFRGNYESGATYTGSPDLVEVVYHNGAYYYSKTTVNGSFSGKTPPTSGENDYWKRFGASFESVATEILFANNGHMGGWNFSNAMMWSNSKNCYMNGRVYSGADTTNTFPVIAISSAGVITPSTDPNQPGKLMSKTELEKIESGAFYVDQNGNMYANNAYIKGTIYSYKGNIGGFALSNTRMEATSADKTKTMLLSADLIKFTDSSVGSTAYLGGDTIPATSGGSLIAPQRLEVTRKLDDYSIGGNAGLYVSVTGATQDDSYVTSGNHALYLAKGNICGFRLRTRRIAKSTTLSTMDSIIIAIRDITLTMPSSPEDGQMYFIRNVGYTVTIDGGGNKVLWGISGGTSTSQQSGKEETIIAIWDNHNKTWWISPCKT